ncbi:MAG: Crp/Fnr family transcriptional regulator [Clostridium sp.]|nr:Crp/Fnr family transcriptional regulator [Clostridium sp.]
MSDNFNTYIQHIDSRAWRDLCVNKGELRRYAKGEEFVSVGKVGKYVGFIISGALKYVTYSEDGADHVMGMVFDGGFVADWPFCIYNQKAKLAIEAATDCEIYCVSTATIKELIDADPKFKDIVMHSTEAVYSTVYDRYMSLYTQSPQERYDELVRKHPDLFDRFTLKDIASFLNISPTHLSRLRNPDKK